MARPCIFCDSKANTKEHVFPKWIAKRVSPHENIFLETVGWFGPIIPRTQNKSLKSHRSRIFCKECQRHFKHLEDEAIPILEPMIAGEKTTLDAEEQRVLGAWGAKTAYSLIAAEKRKPCFGNPVPKDHRKHLRETGEPVKAVWVACGYNDGPARITVSLLPIEEVVREQQRLAYNVVAAFGHVILKVFGVQEPSPQDAFGVPAGRLEQVWPKRGGLINWPPLIPVSQTDVFSFVPLLIPPSTD